MLGLSSPILMIPYTNCKMEDMIDEHKESMRFPDEDAEFFRKTCFSMFHLQHGLQMHCKDHDNKKLFNVTSKCHFRRHIALNSKHLYKSKGKKRCFQGEDQMRRVQRLAGGCPRRLNGMDATTKMVKYLRLAMHFSRRRC